MVTQIFVNLPVESLPRSVGFFTAMGFAFDPVYTNENATCLILGENIFAMLLVKPFFQSSTHKAICETANAAEIITALAVGSRDEVDALVNKAHAAGGQVSGDAKDYGFMYQRDFTDPDGHLWEVFHSSGARLTRRAAWLWRRAARYVNKPCRESRSSCAYSANSSCTCAPSACSKLRWLACAA